MMNKQIFMTILSKMTDSRKCSMLLSLLLLTLFLEFLSLHLRKSESIDTIVVKLGG